MIDSHIHLFERGFTDDEPVDAEIAYYDILRDTYNIETALVIGFEGDRRFIGNNRYILGLAKNNSWIVPLAYLSPDSASARSIDAWVADGAAGFSIYLGSNPKGVEQFRANVWKSIGQHSMVLSINSSPEGLNSLKTVIESAASSAILISHLGLPGRAPGGVRSSAESDLIAGQRVQQLIGLAQYENVYVKLTGLYAIDPNFPHWGAQADVKKVIECFGLSRLVWGTDYSPGLATVPALNLFSLPDWLRSELSDYELENLTHNTMRDILERTK